MTTLIFNKVVKKNINKPQSYRNGLSVFTKICFSSLFILIFSSFLLANANNILNPKEKFNAQWIWQNTDGPANTWMCFRKTVSMSSIPEKAITRIAAESKYWLWINGELVIFEGQLKRDRLAQTYVDEIDLAPYLVSGNNTIAVLVWYWGKEGFSHHDSGKGGFIFDANWGDTHVTSNSTWKTKIHPAYEKSTTGGQANMRLSVSNVRYNAENDTIVGWQKTGYDDGNWIYATEKGTPPVQPWHQLIKRPFPQWKNSGLIEYTKQYSLVDSTTDQTITGVLPYNARISAYLKIKAPKGKLINIQTDQYDGWYDFGEGPAVRAEYITKEGIQEFETFVWMSGNKVEYTIPEGVEIVSLKYREIGYPSDFTGDFSCNDPFFNTLWKMARRTLYINMYDNFMDCPDRERALWWGDVVNQSGEVFYTLDTTAHALIRKSIYTLINWQRDDHSLYSPTSTLWNAELPQQMLASIGWYGFWNYFMNTNDSTTIREAYPAVQKYLSIWNMAPNGLVEHRKGAWDWADWGINIDIDIMDNAWYYLALKAAIPMAEMSGFAQDTVEYHKRMVSIATNFADVFWKEGEQHFRSEKLTIPDDRANAMTIIAGLAKAEHYPGIRKVLKEITFASPYMEKYVLEALCKMGSDSLALLRMKTRYTEMVESEYNTLWEVWSGLKEGTINHGWNAPNTVLSQNIAGISPIKPGWTTYQVMPQMGGLSEVSQVIPSVLGKIKVNHTISSKRYTLSLNSPKGSTAIIGIPKNYTVKSITVNGCKIWEKGELRKKIEGVSLLAEDHKYIKFSVDSGNWKFKAAYIQEK